MELPYVHFNGIKWSIFRLGETAWQLFPETEDNDLDKIHDLLEIIELNKIETLIDFIPSYNSFTLIFDDPNIDINTILSDLASKDSQKKREKKLYSIPVCYELGLDWNEIESLTGLSSDEVIEIHSKPEYTVAMIGFLPGFIFLDGLDERIKAPRKTIPRKSVPKDSVGIGGNQTGLYSLESAGGWQIIGRTRQNFFDVANEPTIKIKAGDKVKFEPISEKEYQKMGSKNG